jgi:2-keto-4-pentenoate hydratase
MRVAEAEFAFRFCKPLPKRDEPYGVEEVLLAVESLHPAIEIPDSRYADFARAGAPQLIADDACACWFLLGEATGADWRVQDLVSHRVEAHLNEKLAETGSGEKVMGDPRVALAWIANELCVYGDGLKPGEFVTTGTCITPVPISGGDSLRADFGEFGAVEASFAG